MEVVYLHLTAMPLLQDLCFCAKRPCLDGSFSTHVKILIMKRMLFFLMISGVLASCHKDDFGIELAEQDYLIFGEFYGECVGENCVSIFKLTAEELFEDVLHDYTKQNFDFVELSEDKFEQVKDLVDFFPNQLLNEEKTILGCPDCADTGGLFIQYSKDGDVKSWSMDKLKMGAPSYLYDFIDKVNEKIALIND